MVEVTEKTMCVICYGEADEATFDYELYLCPNCHKEEFSEPIYSIQSYNVKFDLGPIDVSVNVYHEERTRLTEQEILDEAFGYLSDSGLFKLTEADIFEIETVEIEKAETE